MRFLNDLGLRLRQPSTPRTRRGNPAPLLRTAGQSLARKITRDTTRHRLRDMLSIGMGVGCIWLLAGQLETGIWANVPAALAEIDSLRWALACLATALSLYAVGRYDAVAHRHFQTGINDTDAQRAGITAIALSQTVGFGLFTGTLARWRMLPTLSLPTAARMTGFVAVSFFAGWAVILCLTGLIPGAPLHKWQAVLGLLTVIMAAAALIRWPRIRIIGRDLSLPSLPAAAAIVTWTGIDTFFAALALWILMPINAEISFAILFPVYLLALGAALVGGTPGGVGPFELTLFALLPSTGQADILCGLVAFRVIYYAIPAVCALLLLYRPRITSLFSGPKKRPIDPDLLYAGRRSEVAIILQNGGEIAHHAQGCLAVARTPQSLVALLDPIAGPVPLGRLRHMAAQENRLPLIYKCSARTAIQARQAGWHVLQIAQEAVIDVVNFSSAGPKYRQLRRKLRKAADAGVRTNQPVVLPLHAMAQLNADWAQANGGERGFSMGLFDGAYLARQQVFCAYHDGRLIGFVSFHQTLCELCLDLVRIAPGAPDGTAHALIVRALDHAKNYAIPQLSLAAVPIPENPNAPRTLNLISKVTAAPGLRQFKASFAPRWQPLYAAAPTVLAMIVGLIDVAQAVNRAPNVVAKPRDIHDLDENNEFASGYVA